MDKLTTQIAEMLTEGQVVEWFGDEGIDMEYSWDGDAPQDHTIYFRANRKNYQMTIIESEAQV